MMSNHKSFWCDKCVRAIGFSEHPDGVQHKLEFEKQGWIIEKYKVLCPDCSGWVYQRSWQIHDRK